MNVREFLFSFEGRVSRAAFWLVPITFFIIEAGVIFGLSELVGPSIGILLIVFLLFFFVLSVWISVALGVKRLHDRDKSGHWLWIFWIVPAVLQYASASAGTKSLLGIAIAAAASVLSIWGLVELAFLRGVSGGNIYGGDPLIRS